MPPVEPHEMAFPDIQPNAQVHHPSFGVGKVVHRTGSTEKTAKAVVKFKEEGEKKLSLRFANLTVDKVEEEPTVAPGAAPGAEKEEDEEE